MKFKEYLDEQKQVGTIYHFTKKENLLKLIKKTPSALKTDIFEFISYNGHISTSRNFNLSDDISNKGTSFSLDIYNIRISLDGTKISNNFKVKPIAGFNSNDEDIHNQAKNSDRVLRTDGEAEEVIKSKKSFKLLQYVKQVDIYNYSSKDKAFFEEIEHILSKLNIPCNLVRKFKPLKEYVEDDTTYIIE